MDRMTRLEMKRMNERITEILGIKELLFGWKDGRTQSAVERMKDDQIKMR